jgi:hypothetical protein
MMMGMLVMGMIVTRVPACSVMMMLMPMVPKLGLVEQKKEQHANEQGREQGLGGNL